jgi:hypothetical protein
LNAHLSWAALGILKDHPGSAFNRNAKEERENPCRKILAFSFSAIYDYSPIISTERGT